MNKLNQPILFQGKLSDQHYFEGWYFKQITHDKKHVISFIPGISLVENDRHCFVQYIYAELNSGDERPIRTGYIRYPLEEFSFTNTPFSVQIGDNTFSQTEMNVDLQTENMSIKGSLKLGSFTSIKKTWISPGIMGFFTYIPKMECYHAIISMHHTINGSLSIDHKIINFDKGIGYLEKDWGISFPKEYIWLQCNSFADETVSLFLSIAHIPFMRMSFKGFICNLSVNNAEYRFATYTGSKMKLAKVKNGRINVSFSNRKTILTIEGSSKSPGVLIAPHLGKMKDKIKEELSGEVRFTLTDKSGNLIFENESKAAGIEIVGY